MKLADNIYVYMVVMKERQGQVYYVAEAVLITKYDHSLQLNTDTNKHKSNFQSIISSLLKVHIIII